MKLTLPIIFLAIFSIEYHSLYAVEKNCNIFKLERKSLTETEFHPLASPYLDGGIAQDRFKIKKIDIDGTKITALVDMISTYASPTDTEGFHLSSPLAEMMLAQIGIIHGSYILGYQKKETEVFMKKIEKEFKEPIRSQKNIKFEMEITASKRSRKNPSLVLITYEYKINQGSFSGKTTLAFVMPNLPK